MIVVFPKLFHGQQNFAGFQLWHACSTRRQQPEAFLWILRLKECILYLTQMASATSCVFVLTVARTRIETAHFTRFWDLWFSIFAFWYNFLISTKSFNQWRLSATQSMCKSCWGHTRRGPGMQQRLQHPLHTAQRYRQLMCGNKLAQTST